MRNGWNVLSSFILCMSMKELPVLSLVISDKINIIMLPLED